MLTEGGGKERREMKILKNIALYLLLLIAMVVCGTAVLKIYDLVLNLELGNIWMAGFKVGLIAWILMLIYVYYRRSKVK